MDNLLIVKTLALVGPVSYTANGYFGLCAKTKKPRSFLARAFVKVLIYLVKEIGPSLGNS
jgi:hypothetical protein